MSDKAIEISFVDLNKGKVAPSIQLRIKLPGQKPTYHRLPDSNFKSNINEWPQVIRDQTDNLLFGESERVVLYWDDIEIATDKRM